MVRFIKSLNFIFITLLTGNAILIVFFALKREIIEFIKKVT